jgi:hypothetical protein
MSELKNLQRWDRFYHAREGMENLFPSSDRFYTFLKIYRDDLVSQGALVKTKLGLFVDVTRIESAILQALEVSTT